MPAIHGTKFLYGVLLLAVGISLVTAPTVAASEPAAATKNASHLSAHKTAAIVSKKSKEDQAIDLVWHSPDVKSWLKLFPGGKSKLGGHAAATAEHDHGDVYTVHVYEDLPDHTATLGWYDVNMKTGKIAKKL
jgi:hypothetical protein